MKKTIQVLLLNTVLLVAVSVLTTNAYSADAPAIEVGSVTAEAGTVVEVPVEFIGNPGICSYTLAFSYDVEAMTIEKVIPSEEFGGNFAFGERAVWYNSGDLAKDGVFLTLRFKINRYVEFKDYAIGVFYNAGDVCNYNEDDVNFEVVSGKVTVTAPPATEDTGSDTGPSGGAADSGETAAVPETTGGNSASDADDTADAAESTAAPETTAANEPTETDAPTSGSDDAKADGQRSDFVKEALEKHSENEIRDMIEASLEKVGAKSISEISGDRKTEFVNEVADLLGIGDGVMAELSEEDTLREIAGLYGIAAETASAADGAGSAPEETAADAENGGGSPVNGNIIASVAAAAVAAAAVTAAVIISKKSKKTKKSEK